MKVVDKKSEHPVSYIVAVGASTAAALVGFIGLSTTHEAHALFQGGNTLAVIAVGPIYLLGIVFWLIPLGAAVTMRAYPLISASVLGAMCVFIAPISDLGGFSLAGAVFPISLGLLLASLVAGLAYALPRRPGRHR